jgi:hypothetical protein
LRSVSSAARSQLRSAAKRRRVLPAEAASVLLAPASQMVAARWLLETAATPARVTEQHRSAR